MLVNDIELNVEPGCYELNFEDNTSKSGIFDFDLTDIIVQQSDYQAEKYKGPYDITPATTSQVMKTKNKRMTDDVLIRAVPYFETANESGHTVYIANKIGD